MTLIREDVWEISDAANPWPPTLLAYAHAVRAMQEKPISDPTGWLFQAAINGYDGPLPPRPSWNSGQHRTWFFLPWHRMYLYHFERMIRSHVVAGGGPADWALPFWDYSDVPADSERRTLPHAFRLTSLPDGSPNPLCVTERRPGINSGELALPDALTTTAEALSTPLFTTLPAEPGFGGPVTGFEHAGAEAGVLEDRPHDQVQGAIGGLLSRVATAALDPIFWLHHANIDRLWETWVALGHQNPVQDRRFTEREFAFFDSAGNRVLMMVGSVLDTHQLGYTYLGLISPVAAAQRESFPGGGASPEPRTAVVGRSETGLAVAPEGGETEVTLDELPPELPAVAERAAEPHFHLQFVDVSGERSPGGVYGIYVNLPPDADTEERATHEVGVISFLGIENTTDGDAHSQRYTYDITNVVRRLRAEADPDELKVTLLPLPGLGAEQVDATQAAALVRIDTVAVLVSNV